MSNVFDMIEKIYSDKDDVSKILYNPFETSKVDTGIPDLSRFNTHVYYGKNVPVVPYVLDYGFLNRLYDKLELIETNDNLFKYEEDSINEVERRYQLPDTLIIEEKNSFYNGAITGIGILRIFLQRNLNREFSINVLRQFSDEYTYSDKYVYYLDNSTGYKFPPYKIRILE